MADTPAEVINKETDARFWASTGYRVGQKLDDKNPTDKAMIPVWLDVRRKVKAEYDAGKLVTTYDHPEVAQHLADAHVADQVAAAHLDAAATAPDPATAQANVAAAKTATDVANQKARDAAAKQPPTVSPDRLEDAAREAKKQPPPLDAPAKEHLAHVKVTDFLKPKVPPSPTPTTPRGILDKETDARFWSQTHYRPGHKLDPKDPTDAKMIPVWLDVYRKVKAEDAAGKLVLTYNHPVVAQHLADAHLADLAALAHLDAAAAAPDLPTAQVAVAAAKTATDVSAQKTREAATMQPPTVSPDRAREAAKKVAADRLPSPSARDHLAREQAKMSAARAHETHRHHARHRHPVRSAVHPRSIQDYRAGATQLAHQAGAPYVLVVVRPGAPPTTLRFGSRAELDAQYHAISEQHDQYAYVGAFDLRANPSAPVVDSVGVPAAEHAEVPPSAAAPPEAGPAPGPSEPGPAPAPPEEKPKFWTKGKIIAIGIGVVAAGAIAVAATRKPKRSAARRPSRPSVVVASPTPMAALRA
jgi:hypothetical protein